MSLYLVTRASGYRGHPVGAVFEALIDPAAEQRALARGDIEIRKRITPTLQPGSYRLPRGWATQKEEEVVTHGQ